MTEIRTVFAGRSYVPDVAIVRRESVPRDPSGRIANENIVVPDVAIEILSLRQSVTTMLRTCTNYIENGAAAALLGDPADELITLLRPSRTLSVLGVGDTIDLDDVIPGLRVPVADVFDALTLG